MLHYNWAEHCMLRLQKCMAKVFRRIHLNLFQIFVSSRRSSFGKAQKERKVIRKEKSKEKKKVKWSLFFPFKNNVEICGKHVKFALKFRQFYPKFGTFLPLKRPFYVAKGP